jgi:hypothetical protein
MADAFEEDPCSRFVDYTNATSWEQFVTDIELQLKRWGLNDSGTVIQEKSVRFSVTYLVSADKDCTILFRQHSFLAMGIWL